MLDDILKSTEAETGHKSARLTLSKQGDADSALINNVKDKFREDTDIALEEAISRHNNLSTAGIPTWFWCVFLWYASDNFMGYLSNPIFFYPLVMIATAAVVCHQLGILHILLSTYRPVAQASLNGMLAKLPGGF